MPTVKRKPDQYRFEASVDDGVIEYISGKVGHDGCSTQADVVNRIFARASELGFEEDFAPKKKVKKRVVDVFANMATKKFLARMKKRFGTKAGRTVMLLSAIEFLEEKDSQESK